MSKFTAFLPLLLLTACGGGTPTAEAPKPADSADAAAEKAPADDKADDDKADDKKTDDKADGSKADDKKSDAKPADDGPKPTRSAQDILTAPDVVFMLSFNDSDVKQAADGKCSASSKNDPKKMNQCMAKARKTVDVDGYRFKEKDGKWWLHTLRTQGKILHSVHKFEVEFGAEKDGSISVKPKGKDMGTAAGHMPASITFLVPNEYQIAVVDPKLGKLVYEAKIGIASE